ncbi:MAG: hypothetical protein SFY81_16875 [Verrucomicrobiota bacterium]|nr:hypothetical protein [Verrucomicrobiota bacterium]
MTVHQSIGLHLEGESSDRPLRYVNLKLAALGCPTVSSDQDDFHELAGAFLAHHLESERLLSHHLCPVDQRIQTFLDAYLAGTEHPVRLLHQTFILDQHGLARTLSLPAYGDEFKSDIIHSYRVKQGVLHNPKSDRRTTQGIFHIAEGGLPIPDDKLAVPKKTFAMLLDKALHSPRNLMRLPFTSGQAQEAECWVSLLLRPIVCPSVPGFIREKSMEIRFFAPGNLVSNLDFVESIFGNAGDPFLPENDASLDSEHWTGHTGCVILAPHLITVTKKEVGLPHYDQATERQRRDGMCWKEESDLYNNGSAFKVTARDTRGVMVTVIADNYFGYCKKEVKTQISFSSNLYGLSEEEHAGGALVFTSYDLGEEFSGDLHVRRLQHSFGEVVSLYGGIMDLQPEGYGIDRNYPNIYYVPEDVHMDLRAQTVSWSRDGKTEKIKLLADVTYVRPSGYKLHMEKIDSIRSWRLVGTVAEGTLCHKPCTVSGGGKSEISKSITDAILHGPIFVADLKKDLDKVEQLINRDYSDRFRSDFQRDRDSRPILSSERSLGSVIKLLTPSLQEYTSFYNEWLEQIPQYIKELVFVVKRFYKPEWGKNWREHFTVDVVNGTPGNEIKCDNRKLVTNYLRVGYEADGSWRTFGLRKDYHPTAKIAMEDDITASVVVPGRIVNKDAEGDQSSVKFVKNCEYRLFQRPDEAIHRGYDKQTEKDFSLSDNFFSNYEPLRAEFAKELITDAVGFDKFTPPMQNLIKSVANGGQSSFFVSSAHPRIVDGKPSKNPRYLQIRPDLVNPRDSYLAEIATRLFRRIPLNEPVYNPVHAVLPGRRNNPPDIKNNIRALAVYNPIHFMELPELFMEYICSMTGKSPSTTGAGSEGALTKGPFNALPPIYDLNNALLSYLLTGHNGFVTAAGYVGPKCRVDHDVSLLVPEIWSRMSLQERDPRFLIENGYLEKCQDFEHKGQKVLFSRVGYRITLRFVIIFFGRVFNHPHVVFTREMLKPELQDMDVFLDGMENILTTQKRVAEHYFSDGSVELACPPLKALLHIMREGEFEGKGLDHPEIRALFTREYAISSDWYAERLKAKQKAEIELWERHVNALQAFLSRDTHSDEAHRLHIEDRLIDARKRLHQVRDDAYVEFLQGSLGLEPSLG